jgi:hypothetical protein
MVRPAHMCMYCTWPYCNPKIYVRRKYDGDGTMGGVGEYPARNVAHIRADGRVCLNRANVSEGEVTAV